MQKFGIALLFSAVSLCAQPGAVQIVPVEIAVPFGTAAGKLILHDGYAVFLDDEKPESSFAVSRADMSGFATEAGMMNALFGKNFRDRAGEKNRLSLRALRPEDTDTLQRWFSAPPATPAVSAGSGAGKAGDSSIEFKLEVQQKKRFGKNQKGRLMLAGSQLIFESIDDPSSSRRWELKEIKSLENKNPYELRVEPFTGEDYRFEFVGTPIEAAQYKSLVDKVTSARVK
jgi:hypothetical protein